MSDPTDASSPSSVSPVWPPPPSSAPEMFKVESLTVVKQGDQLSVHDPSLGRWWVFMAVIISGESIAFSVAGMWAERKYLHTWIQPTSHYWPYTSLSHYIIFHAVWWLFAITVATVGSWFAYNRQGKALPALVG